MEKNSKNLIAHIPPQVTQVTSTLEKAGFEVFLVGGCVRDLLMGRVPKDWDLTTNAKPEEIVPLFEKTVYENTFGTVGVCLPLDNVSRETTDKVSYVTSKNVPHETNDTVLQKDAKIDSDGVTHVTNTEYNNSVTHETKEYFIIEVTPYRIEAKYSDFRHPDEVLFSDKLEDDLKRRDFTVNAMAMDSKGHITDIYKGQEDIKAGVLRTVGNPDDRFNEDALRMLRAVRFACQLGFTVSHETSESIFRNNVLLKKISTERIRDEFSKIILSDNPAMGMMMLEKLGMLPHIIPELLDGVGCEQGGEHIYDVWNHLLHALQHAADKKWSLEIRLAALFHDIGKPKTRRDTYASPSASAQVLGSPRDYTRPDHSHKHIGSVSKKRYTFYGHEVVGARMARKIMERLKFTKKETDLVETLVRSHMFFSDTEQITLSAVRRIIAKVGVAHIWDLMNIRECDRVGMKKKEAPYRLRKYFAMIEEALHDPISVKQLKIDGNYLMHTLHMKPGPRMGWVLNALLEEVLEDPIKNEVEYLTNRVEALEKLTDEDLRALGEKAKETKDEREEEAIGKLHAKHGVRSTKS